MRLNWGTESPMLLSMRRALIIAFGLVLVGCHHRQPAMPDSEFEAFRQSHPGMKHACLDAVRYGKHWGDVVDDPDCFEMLPPQHWSGLWNSGWEWSIFCPESAEVCPVSGAYRGVALRFAKSAPPPDVPGSDGILFRMEFIGRRTKVPGFFSHMGQYKHLMVVDHLISMKQVPKVTAEK
jgi:hypothetical protein